MQYICSLSRSGQDHNKEVASNIIFHNPTTSNMSSNTSTAREERTENFEEGLNSPLPSSRPNEADVDVDGLVVAVLENANLPSQTSSTIADDEAVAPNGSSPMISAAS